MKCFVCKNENLFRFLSLGKQPPSDAFLKSKDLKKDEKTYPLDLYYCNDCGLVQLGFVVSPQLLFRDYVYKSGSNNSLKKNFEELVLDLIKDFNLNENDLVVDIGSNDGTLLSFYLPFKVKRLGIDPSSVAEEAAAKGTPTIVDFFTKKLAVKVKARYGQAKVITATNVFAHVKDLYDFMAGVSELLKSKGVFVSESGYLMDMVEKLQYDSIYHEHLRYYSLRPLQILFEQFGMEIFRVQRIPSHGGSIRVFACHAGDFQIELGVNKLMEEERKYGLYDKKNLMRFAKMVRKNKEDLRRLVLKIRKNGRKIVGIGAPAKGNTLLNYCGLGHDLIDYLVERSRLKIGLFTPGQHLPIIDESRLFSDQPEYALLLAWNIAEELVAKLKNLGYKGKFILPTPKPKII